MVNPRHSRGSYYLINRHSLLDVDHIGVYRSDDRTTLFLESNPDFIRELDDAEGIRVLLGILATKSSSRFGDLLPEFAEYAISRSHYKSDSAIRSLLRNRLANMLDRGLVDREGITYTISPSGLDHAVMPGQSPEADVSPMQGVTRAIRDFNNMQVASLRETLSKMHPFKFEHLIRDLLEAMGYEDVIVTRESGDRGVDVVATVQFGITTITEVVQVKRHQGTITRPTIDQLRGALPYHNAIRGTIITTGTFSSGCADAALFLGAAPISLIDGNRLEELLVEHEIGIRKRPATLYEVDSDLLDSVEQQLEEDEISLLG